MTVQAAYSLYDAAREQIILELRKFFTPADPYYSTVLPNGFWVGPGYRDLIYAESAPGVPTKTLGIFDEEQYDDMRIPSIIVTSMAGPTKPAGFGQVGMKPPNTIDTLPTTITPVVAATNLQQVLATDFANGQVIDGVTLVTGNRILIKDQANGQENGVYIVQVAGAPVRSADFNTAPQFIQYTVINVTLGSQNAGLQFIQVTPQPIVLDTTPIIYEQPEFQEFVEVSEPTITFGVRGGTTSQRARLVDLLQFAITNKFLVRGQLEKQEIIFQPNSPGFIRINGYSVEDVVNGGAYPKIYKAELSSTLWLQWNYRVLQDELIAAQIRSNQIH